MTSWTGRLRHPRGGTARGAWTWPRISLPRPRVFVFAAVVVVLVAALLGAALVSLPVFRVRHVQVVGERQVSQEQVLQLAAVPTNTPMIRLAVDAIGARVSTLPSVARVKVVRVWPDTVRIEIDERQPVAYTPLDGGGFGLIDTHGEVYRAIGQAPTGLPQVVGASPVSAPGIAPADPAMAAAVDVARRLPGSLASRVSSVWAATPEDVRLQLRNGSQVRWGDAGRDALKAHVLGLLLRRPASVYDVSAPDAPATTP